MSRPLCSSFAVDLNNLIELKKATGYSENTYLSRARDFDEFCEANYPDADVITEPLAVQWIKNTYEHQRSALHERIAFLRIFGKYQVSMGKKACSMTSSSCTFISPLKSKQMYMMPAK